MSTLIVAFRAASLALFAAPLLLRFIGPARGAGARTRQSGAERVPVLANFAAFGLFFPALVLFRANPEGQAALSLAATGCALAAAGAAVIVWSRFELGSAWSLVPMADKTTGLVVTGPYRLVRHPIYLGFLMLTTGETLAFASLPAALVLLAGIVPSLLWRAVWEERVLRRTFGERYDLYRKQTRMIIPFWAMAVLPLLVLLSFAIPMTRWPTGEREVPPLPLVSGGPAVELPRRVWIDTDAACGHAADADADDCFALLILLTAPGIEVVGISTVHGNAPVEVAELIARELVARTDRTELTVHRGAAAGRTATGRAAAESAADATPAQAALRRALADGPLTIVALGPLTNVAAALRGRPDLVRSVGRIVAVMGRRPGHLFHPTEGRGNGILFGHGPVFRDCNFDNDRAAATEVLALGVPLTLIPYEAARAVSLGDGDLATLKAAGGAPAWVADRARGWLGFWRYVVGLGGFYPFDALAAAYVLEPALFDCAAVRAWIAKDRRLWGGIFSREALLVGLESERAEKPRASGTVLYCTRISSRMHAWLMTRLEGR